MKQFSLLFIFWFLFFTVNAQTATISGYIKDASSGEALIGATCFVPELQQGTTSNQYGFYSLTLPTGLYKINFSFIGYERKTEVVNVEENMILDILLQEKTLQLEDVVVTARQKDENIESAEMSMEKLPVQLVKKLPSFMGEVDVLRTITLLPGIQSGGEGSSGLYVRGGGPDENLLLLDEAPVYNASHLMGFFSVFNSDAIKDIQVYKGGIPAEYGGKASSVIDIRMNDGNTKTFSGKVGIGNM
ncbi:MAG: TonB-dependent receptor, partial [Prolixibacteraceae bacterium]